MDAQVRAAWAALKEWFGARAPREQRLLVGAAIVFMAVLIYSALWEPAFDGRAQIAANLPQLEIQLAEVRAEAEQVRRLRGAAAVRSPAGAGLRDALSASLLTAGVANAQWTVIGKGVQVDVKGAPFNAWMTWLDTVRRTAHVRVVNIHVTADAQLGHATVSATLQPAAG
jgi:general secretion pathway protein M